MLLLYVCMHREFGSMTWLEFLCAPLCPARVPCGFVYGWDIIATVQQTRFQFQGQYSSVAILAQVQGISIVPWANARFPRRGQYHFGAERSLRLPFSHAEKRQAEYEEEETQQRQQVYLEGHRQVTKVGVGSS